ncbi:MAG: nitrate reductase cytochrome c-type subunit [Desulfobulbaceae bacterium]
MKRSCLFLFAVVCIVTFAALVSASDEHGGAKPAAGMDWKAGDAPIPRTFEHQPPLIPHSVDEYKITASQNDCLDCHGVKDSGAPEPDDSHYEDRDDHKSDKVAAQWYFCTQCHVGQVDAKPLIENTFQGK